MIKSVELEKVLEMLEITLCVLPQTEEDYSPHQESSRACAEGISGLISKYGEIPTLLAMFSILYHLGEDLKKSRVKEPTIQ